LASATCSASLPGDHSPQGLGRWRKEDGNLNGDEQGHGFASASLATLDRTE
jgi:hypothetical protein